MILQIWLDGTLIVDSTQGLEPPFQYINGNVFLDALKVVDPFSGQTPTVLSYIKVNNGPALEVFTQESPVQPEISGMSVYRFETVRRSVFDPFDEKMISKYKFN
jgi:hypothetical protein